jgi:hypothetical protein
VLNSAAAAVATTTQNEEKSKGKKPITDQPAAKPTEKEENYCVLLVKTQCSLLIFMPRWNLQ